MPPTTEADAARSLQFDILRRLHALLRIGKLTQIVDIGANPIDGAPPYAPLHEAGLCRIIGFEPDIDALAQLNQKKTGRELYLPYAIGDGAPRTLNLCRYSGWNSTLTPSPAALEVFSFFKENAVIVDKAQINTRRLDDIDEIGEIDFLKIDIQGGELDVFRNATSKLANVGIVQTEVSFVGLYEDQPSFGEIDMELRSQGFIPHHFDAVKRCIISPFEINNDPSRALNQLIEGDMVYVKDFRYPEKLSDHQLRHICLVAHACYRSYDLAYYCVKNLEERGAVSPQTTTAYLDLVNEPLRA